MTAVADAADNVTPLATIDGCPLLEEAHHLYDLLCARAGSLGLLAEEIDPTTGAFLGSFPRAFSHVGVISSGLNLARRSGRLGG